MNFKPNDKNGLGAIGAIILVILLLIVGFVGATIAMPFVVEQGFSVGDKIVYSWTESDGVNTTTYTETNVVTAVTSSTVTYDCNYSDGVGNATYVANITKDGSKIMLNDDVMFLRAALPEERSYNVKMVGFTPILVESYIIEEVVWTWDIYVKAGTRLIIEAEGTDGVNTKKWVLEEATMSWITLI